MNAMTEYYVKVRAAELRADGARHRLAARARPKKVKRGR